jgi:heptosyltransferase-3
MIATLSFMGKQGTPILGHRLSQLMTAPSEYKSILIVCTQRIGDVLLSTPLARSLKRAHPGAVIDYLVLPGTQGVLRGNPDVRQVHVFAQRVGWKEKIHQMRHIWNRYDLALAAVPTDRARLFAWAAGAKRVGFVSNKQSGFQNLWLNQAVEFDDLHTPTVQMNLRLLHGLSLPAVATVVNPVSTTQTPELHAWLDHRHNYAVLHPSPKFRYKMWSDEAWPALGKWLGTHHLRVALTSGPDPDEVAYVEHIATQIGENATSFAGQLDLGQISGLLSQSRLYVGPDTAVTHMAAASGIPTIALFGPSNPVKWGPWPQTWNGPDGPWHMQGSQHQGNVWLIQGSDVRGCVPCRLEGCNQHIQSESLCLQNLSLVEVQKAVLECLRSTPSVA